MWLRIPRLWQPQTDQGKRRRGPAFVSRSRHRWGSPARCGSGLRPRSISDRNPRHVTGQIPGAVACRRIRFEQQESLLKLLAITFGGDPACTDCNRVLRLPGFLNQKYDPPRLVSVEYVSDSISNPRDFRLANPSADAIGLSVPTYRKRPPESTNSEQDWAWVILELARGKDPVKLTRTLAERRADKPNPLYYAQRTVDVASAWLWLKDGLPIGDVVTMLESRRRFQIPSKLCSARAHEIAFTAQRMIARKKIA